MNLKSNREQLNEEQKKAAFCKENAVVSAGAGSGKTMMLAHRFVWLLTEKDYKVDEILTLTFTKKAAAQMFKRIYSLVSQIAQEENGIQVQRAQKAIDDFIHARIQTLDSYSASIVKQCAPRYGISPDFQIDQHRCYNIALEVSYPFFVAHRNNPAIKELYSGNNPNNIVRNILADILFNYCLIDKSRDFSADLNIQFNTLCSQWDVLIKNIRKLLDDIKRDINDDNSLLPVLVPIIEKEKNENIYIPWSADIQKYFNQLQNAPPETIIEEAEIHPLKKSFANILFFVNDIKSVSLRGGKKSDNPVKKNIELLRTLYDSFSSLTTSCMQAGFFISIMSLLDRLQKRYIGRKRTEGVLTFRDVASLSRTILIEQPDIRRNEKDTFKSIMIDEFQDNNEMQKDILFLLAEKRNRMNKGVPPAEDLDKEKLFFVGDEKQSIYMFRSADVSVFRKLKEEIKSEHLPLTTNYRSSAGLIGAFNAIFGGIYPDSGEKTPSKKYNSVFAKSNTMPHFEAEYTPLQSVIDEGGNLSFFILNKNSEADEDQLSVDENEARFVAEKIKQLLNDKYKPDEIAILFRNHSIQFLYEKHLRALGIPYADAENKGLAPFTDEMMNFRDSGGQFSDIEIPSERPNAVHLMTIHKSKGLEFPVVFLCSCGRNSQRDVCDYVYLSDTAGLVLSLPPPLECRSISGKRKNIFWEQANEETKQKRTAELRRLLYVAMTRAEKELYITGSLKIKNDYEIADFSLVLKRYIEEQCAKKENYIEGDSILNNDTIFGLLLPSIVSHIPDDGLKQGSSFFNLEEIPVLMEEDSSIKNEQGLNEFIEEVSPFYENIEVIKTPILRKNHITPVSLKKSGDENKDSSGKSLVINKDFSGFKSKDVFRNVNNILSHFSQSDDETSERFNSGSFGTIAHICIEAHLEKKEIVIPSNISGLLNEKELESLLEAGKKIARRFVVSPLGKIAQTAKLRESEFSFRTLLRNKEGKEIFINGTVDLFFADKDAIHIVDFKTDSNERPYEHTAQMSCYYQAISTLFAAPAKKECRIWLYYLRTGHAIEMTDRVKTANIEQRAFEY